MRPSWNEYFMAIAKIVSTRSTCNSRPIGCVIVRDKQILSTGYNGAVPGARHCIDQPDLDGRPYCFRRASGVPEHDKQAFCVSNHAEANAIAQAAKQGISIMGADVYVTLAPCFNCMKQLAVAQVKRLFYETPYESLNLQRDRFWSEQADALFETCEQLIISEDNARFIADALTEETSKRRLVEPRHPKAT